MAAACSSRAAKSGRPANVAIAKNVGIRASVACPAPIVCSADAAPCANAAHAPKPNANVLSAATSATVAAHALSARHCDAHSNASGNSGASCGLMTRSPKQHPASAGRRRSATRPKPASAAVSRLFWPTSATRNVPGNASAQSVERRRGTIARTVATNSAPVPTTHASAATGYGSQPSGATSSSVCGG